MKVRNLIEHLNKWYKEDDELAVCYWEKQSLKQYTKNAFEVEPTENQLNDMIRDIEKYGLLGDDIFCIVENVLDNRKDN